MTASNVDPLLGTMVGRYRISHVIGHGGMGRVYAAEHPDLGSRVAIKVIAEEHAKDPDLTERFFAEARAVGKIRHDSIVTVLDLQRLPDGRPVIVMELVDGQTLRAILHQGLPPIGGVVAVMIEVLSALAAAHDVDIVHRDLKPDNILVTPGGRAKVLDFGIAKLMSPVAGQGVRTRTGVVLGTPEYMAPEQISGGVIDRRCDVYAAGVVLFEALTGRRPFDGPTDFDVMRHHVDTPAPSLRGLRPEIPLELEQVVLCALAKRPSERFNNALAMANALNAASAALSRDHWRSLTPSALPLRRPTPFSIPPPRESETRVERPATMATHNEKRGSAGRLDGATLAVPSPAPRRPSRPSGAPPTRDAASSQTQPRAAPRPRSRWLVPVLAALGGAGVVAAVFAIGSGGSESTRTPAPAPPAPIVPAPGTLPPSAVGSGFGYGGVLHGQDPKKFDTSAFLPRAIELARKAAPDAQLAMMRADPVGTGGTTDVRANSVLYVFRSTAGAATGACALTVMVRGTDARAFGPAVGGCDVREVALPRCTMAEVLERAREETRIPDLVGAVSLHRMDRAGQQWIVLPASNKVVQIPDDCGTPPAPSASVAPTRKPKAGAPVDAGVVVPVAEASSKTRPDPVVGWTDGHGRWADYNPRRLDLIAYLPRAQALAREMSSDAKLISIRADNVGRDGVLFIKSGADLRLDYRGTKSPCEVVVIPTTEHVVIGPAHDGNPSCESVPHGPPSCTFVQIWKRATADPKFSDLPAGTVAALRWNNNGDRRWTFALQGDDVRRKYDVGDIVLDDSCGMHGSP